MADEGFDRNVASKMPNTKSRRPKRPWQIPPPVEQPAEQDSEAALEDPSMDNLSMDKSPIDNLSMDKSSRDSMSREELSIDNLSMDKPIIEESSMDNLSMDNLSTQNTRYLSDKLAYLFEHLLPDLDPGRQTLLLWLVWLADEQGQTPPVSYRDLSQRCGMSSKTVARTIKGLIENGIIQVEKNAHSREATVYALKLPQLS